ncbi:hypothetical protein LCL95_11225 [Bacillus timonensis]|nr:hypothetical protein [Bacillus timonensis]
MAIFQWIDQLVKTIEDMTHLKPLLPEEDFVIKFEDSNECFFLVMNKTNCAYFREYQSHVDVCVKGLFHKELLKGELKLQHLIKMNDLEVIGSFRDILLVESILHLASIPHEKDL